MARTCGSVPIASRAMFSETPTEVEYRVRVPTGTRRVEIAFALLDSAGSNLWRNEWSDHAAGGEARAVCWAIGSR